MMWVRVVLYDVLPAKKWRYRRMLARERDPARSYSPHDGSDVWIQKRSKTEIELMNLVPGDACVYVFVTRSKNG